MSYVEIGLPEAPMLGGSGVVNHEFLEIHFHVLFQYAKECSSAKDKVGSDYPEMRLALRMAAPEL